MVSDINIHSFAEFKKKLYESTANDEIGTSVLSEKTKMKISDSRGKLKTDDTKIKIGMQTPDGAKGEVLKFDFKYVNSENLSEDDAKKKAIIELDTMLDSQVKGGRLSDDMIGLIAIQKAQSRGAVGYVYHGAVTIYNASAFQPSQLAGLAPINQETAHPEIPNQTGGNNQEVVKALDRGNDPDVAKSLKHRTLSEEVTRPLFEIKIYDASQINAPDKTVDIQQMLTSPTAEEPTPTTQPQPQPVQPAPSTQSQQVQPSQTNQPTVSYTGITKSLTFNQKVQDLQAAIMAKGGTAASMLKTKGGADGKYGEATQKAISLTLSGNENMEVPNPIDQETSDLLVNALSGISQQDIDKQKQQVKPNSTVKPVSPQSQPTPGATTTSQGLQFKTPKGTSFTILETRNYEKSVPQFSYSSYARHIELSRFKKVNESFQINEGPQLDTFKRYANSTNPNEKTIWNTFVKTLSSEIDSGKRNGQIYVNVANKPTYILYTVDSNNQVTLSIAGDFQRTVEDDKKAIEICELIVSQFSNAEFWKPAKGSAFNLQGGDNEEKGKQLYNNWYTSVIKPKLNLLNQYDTNKSVIDKVDAEIRTKLGGSTGNDTAQWTIQTINGPLQYSVDTDF